MKNRILLRTSYGSSAWSGVVPKACITSHENGSIAFGSIDPSSSFAYAVQRFVEDSENSQSSVSKTQIIVWKHQAHSLNDESEEPQVLCTCIHPEDYEMENQNQSHAYNSLACLVPLSFHSNIISGLSLYWCSTNGILCYYDNILGSSSNRSISDTPTVVEYHALTRIPLEKNEIVTFVTSSYGVSSSLGEIIFIGTSFHKVWLCTRTNKPLELRARLLEITRYMEDETDSGNNWLGGFVSKFFTPSKDPSRRMNSMGFATMTDSFHQGVTDPVVSILTVTLADSRTTRPYKGQKNIHPSSVSTTGSIIELLFFVISQSGHISTHSIAYDLHDKVYKDKCLHKISLKARIKRFLLELQSKDPGIIEKTVIQVHVLNAAKDYNCTSIVLCIKVIFADPSASTSDVANNVGRLYLLYCPINAHDFSLDIGATAWLSRFTSEAVTSTDNIIQCTGMSALSDVENANYVDVFVYSVIQSLASERSHIILQAETPVTISGVHFGRFPDDIQNKIHIQIRDIDLPIDFVPAIISGAVSMDSVNNSFVAISSNGNIISTRINFPVLSPASPRKTDARSKEAIQFLKSHLMYEYVIYKRRLEQYHRSFVGIPPTPTSTTSVLSLKTNLPPSITSADPFELSLAAVAASKSLMDDSMRYTSKTNISTFDTTRVLDDIDDKCAAHCGFLDFLVKCQLYKKIDITGRTQLRNHGELLYGVRGLILCWQELLEGTVHAEMDLFYMNSEDLDTDIMSKEQEKVNQILLGCEDNLADFHDRLNSLQLLLYDDGSSKAQPSKVLTSYVFILIGRFAEESIKYRANNSDHQYDMMINPGHLGWDEGVITLGSTDEFLCLYERQLALIESIASEAQKTSLLNGFHSLIETFSCILLEGFRDINYKMRDESRYDAAKRLGIPLVSKYCQENGNVANVDLGFHMSLRHCYFDGIIEGCHDHRESGRGKNAGYDITHYVKSVMAAYSSEANEHDIFSALASARDYRTGLCFPQFVLKWYTDQGLLGTVFELGKLCPKILTQLTIDDHRFTDLRWIQNIRNNDFSLASTTLRREASVQTDQSSGEHSNIFKNRSLTKSLEKLCEAAHV